ncbi:MAG: hypothetical protein R8J94_22645 [Acidimicrobiia bacterium]|nr:hypothetical protein [Acidimicrobiia bacterium]
MDANDDDAMSKDHQELRRALNDEVPAPEPGYWAEIDARLQSVAAEGSTSLAGEEVLLPNVDTAALVERPTNMNATNSPQDTPTNNRFRPLMLIAAAAVLIAGVLALASLRESPTTLDTADDTGIDESVEGAPEESAPPVTEPTVVAASSVPILFPEGFDVTSPITAVEPFEGEIAGSELAGTLCEGGLEARTPTLLPQPTENATAVDVSSQAVVQYMRYVFDAPEDAASVMAMWGEGRCEATVNIVDGVPTDEGVILVADQPVEITVPAAYDAAAIQLETPGDVPVGIVVVGAGPEIVLAVTVAPPEPSDIPRILDTVASAYR